MELNSFNLKEYKKNEAFRIVTGIVAVYEVVLLCLQFFIHLSDFFQFNESPWQVFFVMIYISMLVTMVLLAIYVFAFYGRKQSKLFGISAIFLAVQFLVCCIYTIIEIQGFSGVPSYYYYVTFFEGIIEFLYCIILVIIAFRDINGKKINIQIKILSIISFVFIASFVIMFLVTRFTTIDYQTIGYLILGDELVSNIQFIPLILFVPFILFIVFCKPEHERVKKNVTDSKLQEQEILIADIDTQLFYLKSQFENGKIDQQEYDYERRNLVDKL